MKTTLTLAVILVLAYCNQREKTSSTTVAKKENNDSTKYFQVAQFVQSQIEEVNKTPYFIYQLNIVDNKKDSSAIDNTAFSNLAKPFLHPDITDPSLKKYYTESIFFDETTKSFSLSYATTNKDLEVQNVDVLLEEDGETVKRIFIKKFFNYSDSSAIEQLSWKPNSSFQIIRLTQTNDNKEISRQNVVVWNEKG